MCPLPSPRLFAGSALAWGASPLPGPWAIVTRRGFHDKMGPFHPPAFARAGREAKGSEVLSFRKVLGRFYQCWRISRNNCDAVQPTLGYFFACFYELKCSSPWACASGDPRAFIIYSDSLPAPALWPVAARAANHLSACHHRDGNFTAGSFNHGEFAARTSSLSLSAV